MSRLISTRRYRIHWHLTWTSLNSHLCKLLYVRPGSELTNSTSGVPLTVAPIALTISALSVRTVRIAAIASTPGTVQIKGINLRLPDGSHTEILLPVIDEGEKVKRDKRKSRMSMEISKTKRSGVDARHPIPDAERMEEEGKWLECMVIEEQPLVWIKKSSLTHGTVMLYHGET
jgi:hypothetical protein